MLKYLVVLLILGSCNTSPKSQRVDDLQPYDSSNAPIYGSLYADDGHYPLLNEKAPIEKEVRIKPVNKRRRYYRKPYNKNRKSRSTRRRR